MITYEEVVLFRVYDNEDYHSTMGYYSREEEAAEATSLLNRYQKGDGEECPTDSSASSTTAQTPQ